MRLGKAAMEALQAEISGLLTPGNELVVAGAIALYGTAQIARETHEILREHFSEGFLREAENLRTLYGTADEINIKEAGATAFYAMGEGGFLSALWKMAEAALRTVSIVRSRHIITQIVRYMAFYQRSRL